MPLPPLSLGFELRGLIELMNLRPVWETQQEIVSKKKKKKKAAVKLVNNTQIQFTKIFDMVESQCQY
jgi:hypothetical protein